MLSKKRVNEQLSFTTVKPVILKKHEETVPIEFTDHSLAGFHDYRNGNEMKKVRNLLPDLYLFMIFGYHRRPAAFQTFFIYSYQ